MKNLSNQIKIILVAVVFVLFAGVMFMFGYNILGERNQIIADSVAARRVELEVLAREQKSFEEGKKDLAQLASSEYPPSELFSNDTKVVNEIRQLEQTAQLYNLELEISVAGTTKNAVKVPGTTGELYAVPYTITLTGTFSNTLLFMQATEHMPFITHAKDISVSVISGDESRTVISSEFYIKK